MSIKGRVGRHAHVGGHQCQNWTADQQYVINLLNQIPASQGGAHGTLNGRIISGISSEALYQAILVFEEKYFPGQRSGFVDPNGKLLQRMEKEASQLNTRDVPPPSPQPAPKPVSPLQTLQRNLLDDALASKVDPFFPMYKSQVQPLITLAYKHIDNLIEMGMAELPWRLEMFGRAHVTSLYVDVRTEVTWGSTFLGRDQPVVYYDMHTGESTKARLPEMSYGHPINMDAMEEVTTEWMPAILLYKSGTVAKIAPYRKATLSSLQDPESYTYRSYSVYVTPWAAGN
jgi:hypothetical protein